MTNPADHDAYAEGWDDAHERFCADESTCLHVSHARVIPPVSTPCRCGAEGDGIGGCPACLGAGEVYVTPPASSAPERDRAAEVEAAEDRAEQAAYDVAREREL